MKGIVFKQIFEELYPPTLAEEWDNVGLQVGTMNKDLTNILVTLDLTKDVIQEAINQKCNLILCHHPMIFKPVKTVSSDSYLGSMIEMLVKNDISVYIAHTNFDNAKTGMNAILADLLNLQDLEIFEFVNEEDGLGRIGTLPKPLSLVDFVKQLKQSFQIPVVKVTGEIEKQVQKVAIVGGSGSSVIPASHQYNPDVIITGDVTYHHALDAINTGLTVLDVGHQIERLAFPDMIKQLRKNGVTVPMIISTVDTNPFKIV